MGISSVVVVSYVDIALHLLLKSLKLFVVVLLIFGRNLIDFRFFICCNRFINCEESSFLLELLESLGRQQAPDCFNYETPLSDHL